MTLLCLRYPTHRLGGDPLGDVWGRGWCSCVHLVGAAAPLSSQIAGEISGLIGAAACSRGGSLTAPSHAKEEQGRGAKQTRFVQAIYFVLG